MGDVFAICSMTLFSITNITIKRGYRGAGHANGAFLSILVTAALSATLWLITGLGGDFPDVTVAAAVWFAIAGVLTMFVGRVFLYMSIQHIGAVRGAIVKRLNPFFSVILAVLFLGEQISLLIAAGLLLILLSFALLTQAEVREGSQPGQKESRRAVFRGLVEQGYVFGPISALAYASGYVFRKQGLLEVPDALLGTWIGGLTGIVLFLICGTFHQRYRAEVRATFREFNGWLLAAAVLGSAGQICYFVALKYSDVSKVALISSMEVFLTMFLSCAIFRDKGQISYAVVAAAIAGILGALLIVLS